MLHLVVPGLIWPRESLAKIMSGLELPALTRLLGRGRRLQGPAMTAERWLCRAFGLDQEELPLAALRLLGEGGEPGEEVWLCADPVHLRFSRSTLVIDATAPDLDADEAAQLIASLNEALADAGTFSATHPQRWYLRSRRPARIRTHSIAMVAGRTLEPFLPQGEDALDWRHLINETQVLLHNHPLNRAREEAARPMANSLWLWGAGTLPARAHAPAPRLYADHHLARGLAKLANTPAKPVPERYDGAVLPGLTFLDALATPSQALDAPAWREALIRLETHWFAPLLAALKSRRLDALQLTALGDEARLEVIIRASDAWKFWRRPLTLTALAESS